MTGLIGEHVSLLECSGTILTEKVSTLDRQQPSLLLLPADWTLQTLTSLLLIEKLLEPAILLFKLMFLFFERVIF